jgi:hypothetical protein
VAAKKKKVVGGKKVASRKKKVVPKNKRGKKIITKDKRYHYTQFINELLEGDIPSDVSLSEVSRGGKFSHLEYEEEE